MEVLLPHVKLCSSQPSISPLVPKMPTSQRFISSHSLPGFSDARPFHRSRPLVCQAGRNIRCQAESAVSTPQGYLPQAEFYKVEAILRPWRLSHVASGLLKVGIRGVTVSEVRGFGAQGSSIERQAGSEFTEDNFVSKIKMEIVISKDQVDAVINCIIGQARTGEIGDGKIFVVPVADVIRVRTGERGLQAERMAGGRADILASLNGSGFS